MRCGWVLEPGLTDPDLDPEVNLVHSEKSSNLETPLNYLELRWWVGMFTGIFCIIIVMVDGSVCVKYITRYTEESFATLISLIFIGDGFGKLMSISDHSPVNYDWTKESILSYSCKCEQPTYSKSDWFDPSIHTADWWSANASNMGKGSYFGVISTAPKKHYFSPFLQLW